MAARNGLTKSTATGGRLPWDSYDMTSNDPHGRELNRLKLALATFALQLDTFELRTHILLNAIGSVGHREGERRPSKESGLAGQ